MHTPIYFVGTRFSAPAILTVGTIETPPLVHRQYQDPNALLLERLSLFSFGTSEVSEAQRVIVLACVSGFLTPSALNMLLSHSPVPAHSGTPSCYLLSLARSGLPEYMGAAVLATH